MRIADDRLSILRLSSICPTSLGTLIFLWTAISSSPYRNSSSNDRLVFRPLIKIECLKTAVFMPYFQPRSGPGSILYRTSLSDRRMASVGEGFLNHKDENGYRGEVIAAKISPAQPRSLVVLPSAHNRQQS
jgi:hypothetical protein